MIDLCFYLEGKPVSLNNAYFNRSKGRTMTAEARAWKELVAWHARRAHSGPPTKERVSVGIWLYFPDQRRRDLSNHVKLIEDAMTGIIYEDDCLIDELHIHRRTGGPAIAVAVRTLDKQVVA